LSSARHGAVTSLATRLLAWPSSFSSARPCRRLAFSCVPQLPPWKTCVRKEEREGIWSVKIDWKQSEARRADMARCCKGAAKWIACSAESSKTLNHADCQRRAVTSLLARRRRPPRRRRRGARRESSKTRRVSVVVLRTTCSLFVVWRELFYEQLHSRQKA